MKAELRLAAHQVLPGEQVIEVWYAGEFIAQVTGADGPGVRVISKHPLSADLDDGGAGAPVVMTVWIANGERR